MNDLENSLSESPNMSEFIMKNSYFVLLIFCGIGLFFYQFAAKEFNLESIKNITSTNIIESINKFIGEFWLSSNMENDTIVVENNQKDGLLDRIVEKMDNYDV
jgi:hypothetical protein